MESSVTSDAEKSLRSDTGLVISLLRVLNRRLPAIHAHVEGYSCLFILVEIVLARRKGKS